jgi:hypothetical protein
MGYESYCYVLWKGKVKASKRGPETNAEEIVSRSMCQAAMDVNINMAEHVRAARTAARG